MAAPAAFAHVVATRYRKLVDTWGGSSGGPDSTSQRSRKEGGPARPVHMGSYQHHKELKAAQGIKITAQGLVHAIAGTQLYVVGPEDDIDDIKYEAMQDIKNVYSRVDKSGEGVCVQASTLGSLMPCWSF